MTLAGIVLAAVALPSPGAPVEECDQCASASAPIFETSRLASPPGPSIHSERRPRRPVGRATPFPFRMSSPEAEDLDGGQLALAFDKASHIPQMYSMLVLRNGRLVAEEYFAQPDRNTAMPVASVGKSILSVLTGISLSDGYLDDLDQTMIGFFPEYDLPFLDPRKRAITIRQLLTMRSGYPFDSTTRFFNLISATH